MKKIIVLIIVCLSQLPAVLCAQPIDAILAVVGDKIVLKSDVESQYYQIIQQGGTAGQDLKCQILDQLIATKLLYRQAEIDSIEVSEGEVDQQIEQRLQYFVQMFEGSSEKLEKFYGKSIPELKEEFREPIKEQLLSQRMEAKITEGLSVSPAEVKTYFKKIPSDSLPYFETELELGQVVIYPVISETQRQYTIDKLKDIRTRIIKGETFGTLAVLYSEDPGSRSKGGDLGFIERGQMVPEFEGAAYRLKEGEVSDVFKTRYGYHIIQMIERKGDRAHVRHILLVPQPGDKDLEAAAAKMDSLRQEILNGSLSFSEAVRRFSMDEDSKANAGLIINPQTRQNTFTVAQLGQMPQNLYFSIKELQAGDLTKSMPYFSEDGKKGFRILYVKSKSKPHKANLKDDYDKIKTASLSAKRAQTMATWYEKHRKEAYMRIDADYRKSCDVLNKWYE